MVVACTYTFLTATCCYLKGHIVMKIKVATATGLILDWAVAKAADVENPDLIFAKRSKSRLYFWGWSPSTNFSQGAQLLEKFGVSTVCEFPELPEKREWLASISNEFVQRGPTQLVAGMRCLAATHFGEDIVVPDSLLEDGA